MSKGKNFSTNNVKKKRKEADLYETPYSMTKQFLETGLIPRSEHILEPAAGNGAIVRVLEEEGYQVTSYDLSRGRDFLLDDSQYDVVFTNPPFSHAQKFILHAKEVAPQKIVLLMPLNYLHGKQRYGTVWTDTEFPLASVHVFTRYVLLGEPLRADGKYHTAIMVYAWYVWDREHKGEPAIRWIDNNDFVLRAGD